MFIATNSLFLLREMDLLLAEQPIDERGLTLPMFLGLHREDGAVTVQSGMELGSIGSIAALDEELAQEDRAFRSDVDADG